jgi:hypothetical protein
LSKYGLFKAGVSNSNLCEGHIPKKKRFAGRVFETPGLRIFGMISLDTRFTTQGLIVHNTKRIFIVTGTKVSVITICHVTEERKNE